MASVFPHESACVIPHQCFFVFSVWHGEFTLYLFSISVLVPQVLCIIRIADFLIISF
jgi:hypothetical protein